MKKRLLLVTFLIILSAFHLEGHAYPTLDRSLLDRSTTIDEFLTLLRQTNTTKKHRSSFINANAEFILSMNPSIQQLVDLKGYSSTIDLSMKLHQFGLTKVSCSNDFLKLVDFGIPNPNKNYRNQLSHFIWKNHDIFFNLKPSAQDIIALKPYCRHLKLVMELNKRGIDKITSTRDFLKLIDFGVSNPSPNYKKELSYFIRENLDFFFGLKPSIQDIAKLKKCCRHLDLVMKLNQRGLNKVTSAHDFLQLIDFGIPNPNKNYKRHLSSFVWENRKIFFKLNPSTQDIVKLKDYCCYIDLPRSLKLQFFDDAAKLTSAKHFLKLLDVEVPESYKEPLSYFIWENIELFFNLKPSVQDIIQLKSYSCYVDLVMKLNQRGLDKVTSPLDFLKLIDFEIPNPNNYYKEKVSAFVLEHIQTFYSLNPTNKDIHRLVDYYCPKLNSLKPILLTRNLSFEDIEKHIIGLQQATINELNQMYKKHQKDLKPLICNAKYRYRKDQIRRQKLATQNKVGEIVLKARDTLSHVPPSNKRSLVRNILSLKDELNNTFKLAETEMKHERSIFRQRVSLKTKWKIPTTLGRSVSTTNLDKLIHEINSKREKRKAKASNDPSSECPICYNIKDEEVVISSCQHALCKQCFNQYIKFKIEEDTFPITCFTFDCSTLLTEQDFQQADLDTDALNKWKQQTRLNLPNTLKCTSTNCNQVLYLQENLMGNEVLCNKCLQNICTDCGGFSHKGFTCEEGRKVNSYFRSGAYEDFERMVQNKIVQRCPHCGAPGIRKDGCPKINCRKCKKSWNYRGEYRIDTDKSIK